MRLGYIYRDETLESITSDTLMDTAVFFEGIRGVFYFFLLLLVPGFALSLVIFPRPASLSIIDRLVYSTVLGISSGIAIMLFMDVVPGLDTTPANLILVIGVFSVLLLMFWGCERWYLNNRQKKRKKPQSSADKQEPWSYYSRETNTAPDQFRQDTGAVTAGDIPVQPDKNPLPGEVWPGIETGGTVKVPEVQIRDKPHKTPEWTVVPSDVEPAGIKKVSGILTGVEQQKEPKSPAIRPRILLKDIHEHLVTPAGVEPKKVLTRQNVLPRVVSNEMLKHEETTIVVESIKKLQKDILRDLDMFYVLPDSLKRSGQNIENVRIPGKADVNKKLAEVQEELNNLDWLYE